MDAPKVEPERESPERDKSEDVPAGIVKTPTPIAAVDVGSPSTFHPGAPDLPAPMPAGRKVPTGPGGASSMPSPADPSILVAAGTPTSIFHSAMEKNPTIPVARVGIALSGGGSKGDFEVGALRYLYDHTFVRPDIICGTSVGSINGVQLSEGADTSLAELESIWLNVLHSDTDMWQTEQWVRDLPDNLQGILGRGLASGAAMGGPLLCPVPDIGMFLIGLLTLVPTFNDFKTLVNHLAAGRSYANINPISRQLKEKEPAWSATGPGLRGHALTIGRNTDGRLEVFVRAWDDTLWHKWQLAPNPISARGWSEWRIMGPEHITSDPCFFQNADGSLWGIVARLDDNHLHYRTLDRADIVRPEWSDWEQLGYSPSGWEEINHIPRNWMSNPATCQVTGSGAPVISVRDSFNVPFETRWDGRPGANRWAGFSQAGFVGPTSRLTGNFAVGSSANGSLTTFARGTDYGIYYCSENEGGNWHRWDGLTNADPVVINNSGILTVFIRGMNNAVYVRHQTSPDVSPGSGSWTNWMELGGSFTSNVAVGTNQDGRLEFFARGNDSSLYHKWQNSDGSWNADYSDLGRPDGVDWLTDPTVVTNVDGRMEAFVVGSDLAVWHIRQIAPNSGWSEWESLDGRVWPGTALRLAMVNLQTGELRHVSESGRFVGAPDEATVLVSDAVLASASIPVFFRPIRLNEQTYVDGGVASVTPIRAALDAGVDVLYAIVASAPRASAQASLLPDGDLVDSVLQPNFVTHGIADFNTVGMVDIGMRSVELLVHSITELELHPHVPWQKPVFIIQPTLDTHGAMTIAPGLIRLSMAYGFMRAYDVVDAPDQADAQQSSDAITQLRIDIHQLEESVIDEVATAGRAMDNHGWYPIRETMQTIRSKKRDLKAAVEARIDMGHAIPADLERGDWWNGWEAHGRNMPASTPWASFDTGGTSVPAEPLP